MITSSPDASWTGVCHVWRAVNCTDRGRAAFVESHDRCSSGTGSTTSVSVRAKTNIETERIVAFVAALDWTALPEAIG